MAKILVVDDEPVNRELIVAILSPLGHAVYQASNGDEAAALAEELAPDLAIVDLYMPGLSGAELIKRLRRRDGLKVLLYTATRPDDALRDFMRANGVAGVILKPAEPADIMNAVAVALA